MTEKKTQVSLRLSGWFIRHADKLAKERGKTRTEIIRAAVKRGLAELEGERQMRAAFPEVDR